LPTDPEDDDLDELDDVLSQFTPGQKITASSLSSPPPPPLPPRLDITHEEELDFARELAKGMEDLMRELSADAEGKTSTDNGGSDQSAENARALKSAWEQMLVEGMGNNPGIGQFSGNEASTGGGGFQDKIKQAVNKLKESESNLQADGKSPNGASNAESLEALLGSLGDFGLDEGGDDKDLTGLLENMMGELMGKSILYEPLSELAQGFPPYLANPPSPLSAEDRKRYDLQLGCVRRVLAVFDQAGYDDKNAECQQQIADLMTEMQNYGSPPTVLMGPLPDLNEEGCRIV